MKKITDIDKNVKQIKQFGKSKINEYDDISSIMGTKEIMGAKDNQSVFEQKLDQITHKISLVKEKVEILLSILTPFRKNTADSSNENLPIKGCNELQVHAPIELYIEKRKSELDNIDNLIQDFLNNNILT